MQDESLPKPKQKRHRVNYALAATMLTSGATMEEIAAQVGAKNANVLRVGLHRRGVTKKLATDQPLSSEVTQSLTLRVARQASDMLRDRFSSQLAKTTDALDRLPLSATYKSLRQRADLLEPLARTAKIVCGWDDSGTAKAVDLSVMVAVRVDQAPQPVVSSGAAESEPIDVTPQDAVSSSPSSKED